RQRPVDPLGGVPLLVLALLVQVEQPLAPVVVLPGEAGVTSGGDVPRRGDVDRAGVLRGAAHRVFPSCGAWRCCGGGSVSKRRATSARRAASTSAGRSVGRTR